MRSFIVLVAFCAQILSISAHGVAYHMSDSTCDSITSEKTCMSTSAEGEKCSWCNSAAVGGSCFKASDAQGLPSSVFQCEFQKAVLKGTVDCDTVTSEKTCMASSSSSEHCSWCNSAAVGGSCMGETDAKSLPSSVFQCEYQKRALKTSTCDSITSEKTCMSTTSGSDKCSWCNSAAVGGTCFTEADAKSLPSSVFQCEFQKAQLRAPSSCDGVTSEKTCLTTTVNSEKCAWCESAAVGATCYPESDAHSLPSSIFQCEYQTPGAFLRGN